MQYANPLYDHAFKYLMLNNKLAKKALSTILGKRVVKLHLEQQETVLESPLLGFSVFYLDFKATIEHEDGRREQVLIEVQKSKKTGDLERFRKYISTSYAQKLDDPAQEEDAPVKPLPLVVVYILGFDLPEIKSLAVKIGKKVVDLSSQATLDIKSDFVDAVTHDCYILQVGRVPKQPRTLIEQFLSLFDQSNISTEKRYILDVEEAKIPNPFLDMATHLKKPLLDKDYQRKLELEQELDNMLLRQIRQVERANKKVEELEQEVEEVELKVAEAKLKANEAELKANEAELKANESNALLRTAILGMQAQGFTQDTILAILNITPDKLNDIV